MTLEILVAVILYAWAGITIAYYNREVIRSNTDHDIPTALFVMLLFVVLWPLCVPWDIATGK